MRKINFELIFKITVILLLSCILYVVSTNDDSNYDYPSVQSEPNEIGRYKELEHGAILDTKTGQVDRSNEIPYRFRK
jgi:hypothetical protein